MIFLYTKKRRNLSYKTCKIIKSGTPKIIADVLYIDATAQAFSAY